MNISKAILKTINRLLHKTPYYINKKEIQKDFPDISDDDMEKIKAVTQYTMTSLERRYHLLQSVRHIIRHNIPGSFVECGVWKGGGMMLVAEELIANKNLNREIYLYDTYEGMPAPTEHDKDFNNLSAISRMQYDEEIKKDSLIWAIANLQEVKNNMDKTGYPLEKIHYVVGKVENTIPNTVPEKIALLRLDTDWYESTLHELRHLYPLVSSGGVIIIDDYGFWKGSRKAVDEFIESTDDKILLHRLDDTARAFIKQ